MQPKESRGSEYVVWFKYIVDGKECTYDDTWEEVSVPPRVGDEIEILYDREDPERCMTRHQIAGAPGGVPWLSLFILLLSAAFPVGAWAGWISLQTWRRGEPVQCRILSKKELGAQKQARILYVVEYAFGGKTWKRSPNLAKADPAREHNGTSYALVHPRDPRRVMLVPTSAWDLAEQDPRESLDRFLVWGGGTIGGVCGLLGLLLLGFALTHSEGTNDVAAAKPEAAGAAPAVAATETWLCVDNTGEAPIEVRLDDAPFELAPWTLVKRPLAAGKRRLLVAAAGVTLFEKEFEPRAGVVYLCDPLKHGSYVTWAESWYCDGHEFIRYAFGREHRDEWTLAAVDWREIPDGLPPGVPVARTAKETCSRTVLRKRPPEPFPAALAERLLANGGLEADVWDGDVRELALRARATGGK